MSRAVKQSVYHHGLNAVLRVAPALPDRVAFGIGRAAGRILARFHPHRGLALENIRRAFGDEMDEAALRQLLRQSAEHAMVTFFEILRMGRLTREQLLAESEIVGQNHLECARAEGRGVIVIGGHLGNWEVGGAALAQRGFPLAVVSVPQRNALLQDYLAGVRDRFDIRAIPMASLRDCFACLRGGGHLVLMVDQRVRNGGLIVPFFGHPASSAPGPAALALKTGAPVVPISAQRLPDGRHRVWIDPPVPLIRTGDRERDLYENTARHQLAVEAAIRRCPDQWLWTYRRWGMRVVRERRRRTGRIDVEETAEKLDNGGQGPEIGA